MVGLSQTFLSLGFVSEVAVLLVVEPDPLIYGYTSTSEDSSAFIDCSMEVMGFVLQHADLPDHQENVLRLVAQRIVIVLRLELEHCQSVQQHHCRLPHRPRRTQS